MLLFTHFFFIQVFYDVCPNTRWYGTFNFRQNNISLRLSRNTSVILLKWSSGDIYIKEDFLRLFSNRARCTFKVPLPYFLQAVNLTRLLSPFHRIFVSSRWPSVGSSYRWQSTPPILCTLERLMYFTYYYRSLALIPMLSPLQRAPQHRICSSVYNNAATSYQVLAYPFISTLISSDRCSLHAFPKVLPLANGCS